MHQIEFDSTIVILKFDDLSFEACGEHGASAC